MALMKTVALLMLSAVLSGPIYAATIVSGEPAQGSVPDGQSVAYRSRECSSKNPAKDFKVVRAKSGKRITVGCFSEAEAARK